MLMGLCFLIVKAAQMLNRLRFQVATAVQTQTTLSLLMVMVTQMRSPQFLLIATVVRKQKYWRLQVVMVVQMPNRPSRRQKQMFQ